MFIAVTFKVALFTFKVPAIAAPSPNVKLLSTFVVPEPLIFLFKVPERVIFPSLVIVPVKLLAFAITFPLLDRFPILAATFNLPVGATFTAWDIVALFVTVPVIFVVPKPVTEEVNVPALSVRLLLFSIPLVAVILLASELIVPEFVILFVAVIVPLLVRLPVFVIVVWVIAPVFWEFPAIERLPEPFIVALFVNAFTEDVPLLVMVPLLVAVADIAILFTVKFPLLDSVFCVNEFIWTFDNVSISVEPVPVIFVPVVLPFRFNLPALAISPSISAFSIVVLASELVAFIILLLDVIFTFWIVNLLFPAIVIPS